MHKATMKEYKRVLPNCGCKVITVTSFHSPVIVYSYKLYTRRFLILRVAINSGLHVYSMYIYYISILANVMLCL